MPIDGSGKYLVPGHLHMHAHPLELKDPTGALEEAGLILTRRSGREKLHFLNPVPIRLIHDRWIDKYTAGPASLLANLKNALEDDE